MVKLDGGYYLAFRGTEGVGMSAYDAYVSSSHDDDSFTRAFLPCGCLTVDSRDFCGRHYKSRIVTHWSSMEIKEVRGG